MIRRLVFSLFLCLSSCGTSSERPSFASPPETALTLLRLLAVALGLGLAVAGDRAAVAPVVTIASIAATIAPGANAAYLRKLPIDIIHASLGFLRGHLPRNTHG